MMSRDPTRGLAVFVPALLVASVIASALAGCASRSLNPPPVIDRSGEAGGVRAVPGTVVPVPPPVAVTQPIGSEVVEQRPLGTPPSGSTVPPTLPPIAAPSNAPQKTGPLGLKRPYSEAILAELSRPDSGATPPGVVAVAPEAVKQAAGDAAPNIVWAWPAGGKIVDRFAEGKTKGIDIAGKPGDAVLAAGDGKVIFSGSRVRGYGNFVIVRHNAELLSVYAHNKSNLVKEDAVVSRGQKIAEMGNTDADAVKLHFEIRQGGKPVDPLRFLPER